ncbi:lysosomal alpha-mannosidase [Hyalella azteca]|uniref:Alpha-mannosidase n=1 Tax=Hyalella azteca TaxID=294128 RepID=A0A8B7N3F6_HYAAZ|nr:lysosomal alpha-mannosidase [Hyalella azteca]
MSLRPALLLVLLAAASWSNPACPTFDPDLVTVHLVCHTHDDVGWLKTVDQYFYGANNSIQRAGVQYTIDSVVNELGKNATRKFSYVEMAFFTRWWHQQNDEVKDQVKALVASGQLELLNGGWSMNDEAAAHYTAIVDQMTLGLVFINQTFGPNARPRVAWQIDPFGHSNEQASLFAQMGFDGLFFARVDYHDKDKRWTSKNMEMVWQPSQSLGEAAWLFTGVLPNHYEPPSGFCFDDLCSDPPIMDDPMLEDYNVDSRVLEFLDAVSAQAEAFRTNQLIMTMGSDFQYQNAATWYKNLDKLIKYVNARQEAGSKVRVTYSTPSCYVDALHASQISWGTKQDDFFPYASDPHAYWTGYFTSRPTFKGMIRKANGFHQAQKQLLAVTGSGRTSGLERMAATLGVTQHHDAVTGTAKQHVTDDYYKRLDVALQASQDELVPVIRKLSTGGFGSAGAKAAGAVSFCPQLNISSCELTETSENFQVVVYNSIARPIDTPVRIPVPDFAYKVTDYQGNGIISQLVPVPDAIQAIPYRTSAAVFELVFMAQAVPPLGSTTYQVTRTAARGVYESQKSMRRKITEGNDGFISQGRVSVRVDGSTGSLSGILYATKYGVKEITVTGEKLFYHGTSGDNSEFDLRASGAYIFRPNGTDAFPVQASNTVQFEGEVVSEIHVEYGSWVSEVIRTYKGFPQVETEWLVGPISLSDGFGKEVITRYTVEGMATNNTFYTDANGREMQKRTKDYRATWEQEITEPVSWNYYPVTARLLLQSSNDMGKFVVLTDRAQGGTSLSDGQVELMVHRRLFFDDAFGVGEALDEMAYGRGLIARGVHWLLHSDAATADCDFACLHRRLGEELFMRPLIMFQDGTDPMPAPVSNLKSPLPEQVHLMTLEPWLSSGQFLLRLEHMFEAGESANFSVPVTVDLQNLLTKYTITDAQETVLSANQWAADSTRLQWQVEGQEFAEQLVQLEEETENNWLYGRAKVLAEIFSHFSENTYTSPRFGQPKRPKADLSVTLQPMQIRTFVITVQTAT